MSDEVTKRDQAAWEAPELRPIFTPDGRKEAGWLTDCPTWCDGDGEGHDPDSVVNYGRRWHESAAYQVRQDTTRGYWTDEDGRDGMMAANFTVQLEMGSWGVFPKVRLRRWFGMADGKGSWRRGTQDLGSLGQHEVRELICVLQHLLKVAQEDIPLG